MIAGKDITVREARILLSSGGGKLTGWELVMEGLWAIALSATLAWAIAVGKATVWHLLIPMLCELVAYLACIPVLSLFFRHPELRKVSWQCLRSLAVNASVAVIAVVVRSRLAGVSFTEQWNADTAILWSWIFGSQMHWPMLVASLHMIRNTTRSVQHLISHGPPFLGPGMGCGMRIAVMILAAVIVPALCIVILGFLKDINSKWLPALAPTIILAWALWACLLAADLCLLWFRWDIQSKLRKRGLPVAVAKPGRP